MKKITILSFFFILITNYDCFGCAFNEKNIIKNKKYKDIIFEIQEEYRKTNSDCALTTIKKTDPNMPHEEFFFYYDEYGNLKKVITTYYGEMGYIKKSYFYKDNNLILFLQKEIDYNQPFYIEGFQEDKREENMYYFHNESLIKWTYKNENVKINIDQINTINKNINTEESQKIASEVLTEAKEILNKKFEQQKRIDI